MNAKDLKDGVATSGSSEATFFMIGKRNTRHALLDKCADVGSVLTLRVK